MRERVITEDERRCLRMWFRQAIAQVEREEVTTAICLEKFYEEASKHRNHAAGRPRTRRSRIIPHLRELVF